jgi:CHAT domain-containing protein
MWRGDPPWQPPWALGQSLERLGDASGADAVPSYERALAEYERGIEELEAQRALLGRDELRTAIAADLGVESLYFDATRVALKLAEKLEDERARRAVAERAFALSEQGRSRRPLEEELHETEKALGVSGPDFFGAARTAGAVSLVDQVRVRLAPGTAILEYMSLDRHLLVWAITQDGLTAGSTFEIPAAQLSRLACEFHSACLVGLPFAEVVAAGEPLSEQLLAPFDAVIEAHERLVIVPWGDLHVVPFAALRWRGDWFGAQKTLTYLPSASLLTRLPARQAVFGPVLAVGNPREAEEVAAIMGGLALGGGDATGDRVRTELSRHRLVHFATHAVLDEESPLLSGIALAHGEALGVYEIVGNRLNVDLVTLSACKTLGGRTRGDAILGLSHGLLAAGAGSAVLPLWPVLDVSTAVLMVKLYQALDEGAEPAEALRRAQASMRALTSGDLAAERARRGNLPAESEAAPVGGEHPLHWAAFVVVGP